MAGNSSNSSTTSTGSAAGAAGAGVGAGVGSASAGNQTSSTGPSSTSGKGNNSGNYSGGLPGLGGQSWGSYTNSKGSETNAAHSSGVQGPGLANGNFGSEWGGSGKYSVSPNAEGKHSLMPGADGKHTLRTDGGDGKGNYSTNNIQYMTVDEVYGKGNQSIVESQGDYEAVSNEKSNVETQTFGKQDEISVTPVSITEDKGEVDNAAIQSVEGLDFQQKDKVAQEVMDAKKSRDEAEAEDKSDKAREQLAAKEEAENEEITFDFKVGEKNDFEEQNQARLNDIKQQKQELKDINEYVNYAKENLNNAKEEHAKTKEALEAAQRVAAEKEAQINELVNLIDSRDKADKTNLLTRIGALLSPTAAEVSEINKGNLTELAEFYGIEAKDDITKANTEQLLTIAKDIQNQIKGKNNDIITQTQEKYDNQAKNIKALEADYTKAVAEQKTVQDKYTKTEEAYNTWKADYWANAEKAKAEEEAANAKSNAEVSFEAARNEINNADIAEETKAEAIEAINNVEAATKSVNDAADALAANPNDPAAIETYVNAVKAYNENVKNALKGNPLAKTDFNKTFTEMVAKANDFDVTMPDGTKVSYAEFAAEKAVESPALAKGLYEAKAKYYADKAKELEDNGEKGIRSAAYRALAAIKTKESEMAMTWLGSKFTFADNQVRAQFNQMAKTDMRATYATYNNVLNDETGKYSEADKAEASAEIDQANALMTASAALKASTGFWSGIGDSMADGVYGVTDPGKLNGYQKALNTASNLAKVVLGLGVTPGANEAYQNMYYLAGDKAKNSMLFGKDFDGDGFALCQEYGNNAAVGMIAGAGELATGIALFFNPATAGMGLNLAIDSIQTFLDGLYGVQREAQKSVQYSSEIVSYLKEAKDIAAEAGTEKEKTVSTTGVTIDRVIDSAISQIESFELKSDEANNLDNWLEGSGSATTGNEKFNQSLTYDEWLKLIEADPTMQEYAKKLIAEKA